jgi:hypothetical protein
MLKSYSRSKKYKAVLRKSPADKGGKQAGNCCFKNKCKYKAYLSEKQKKVYFGIDIEFT